MTADPNHTPAASPSPDPPLADERCCGTVVMTAAVAALGPDVVRRVARTLCVFDRFCRAVDPDRLDHREGALEVAGRTVLFAIADEPATGGRLITLALADRS